VSFVPRSLFSRLVAVLLAGLLVAQVLSLALHAHDRGILLSQASGLQSAQRIADIVRVLEPLAPAERAKMVRLLSAPPLLISIGASSSSVPAGDAATNGARAAMFATMVQRYLDEEWPVSVSLIDHPAAQAPMPMHPFMHGAGMDRPDMRARMQGGIAFVATVRLHDGTPVTFDARQPPETAGWPLRLVGSLVILLVTVVALSLIAVRWATRPLAALAEAADELGKDINRRPLPESGPLEVQRAARAFNAMQARLAGYVRDRTRILAAMSHDLKTPITRLRLRAELLDDAVVRSKFENDLREMETMVAGTLDFMKGLEDPEAAQPIDVDALLHSIVSDLRETGACAEIEGAVRGPYRGKPQALKRCVSNLAENAVKYGKCARIAIDDAADKLTVYVRDEGPGIPNDLLERVFDPFYRLEPSRSRATGGTGLGLSIARAIAEAHGGSVALRNRPEGGLEAILTLPRG
jgi:signal transduction histidine kinase